MPDEILIECETAYMDGVADDVSGDVECLTGHFYRVGRHVIVTDSQGFRNRYSFDTVEEAKRNFAELDREYGDWLGEIGS
jgi:hypothetical protein